MSLYYAILNKSEALLHPGIVQRKIMKLDRAEPIHGYIAPWARTSFLRKHQFAPKSRLDAGVRHLQFSPLNSIVVTEYLQSGHVNLLSC
jgi:hypothetical protein